MPRLRSVGRGEYRRLWAVLFAILLGATGMLLGPASPAAASVDALGSVAPLTGPITTAGTVDCPAGYVCFWVDADFKGPMGKLEGNNTNWSIFPQRDCA